MTCVNSEKSFPQPAQNGLASAPLWAAVVIGNPWNTIRERVTEQLPPDDVDVGPPLDSPPSDEGPIEQKGIDKTKLKEPNMSVEQVKERVSMIRGKIQDIITRQIAAESIDVCRFAASYGGHHRPKGTGQTAIRRAAVANMLGAASEGLLLSHLTMGEIKCELLAALADDDHFAWMRVGDLRHLLDQRPDDHLGGELDEQFHSLQFGQARLTKEAAKNAVVAGNVTGPPTIVGGGPVVRSEKALVAVDNSTSFTVKEPGNELDDPDPAWDADRLGEFAKIENERLMWYEKRMGVHVYRLGKALKFAYDIITKTYGHWGRFLKKYGISEATDWRARELYEAATKKGHTEKDLEGHGINEAYRKYKIGKKKGTKKTPPSDAPVPPKENPLSLPVFLAKVTAQIEEYKDEAAFLKEDNHSPQHCIELIEQAIARLVELKGVVESHAK